MDINKLAAGFILGVLAFQSNAGFFSSDAGMDKDCLNTHSKAWCIWDAADMSKDVSDFRKKDIDDRYKSQDNGGFELGMAALSTTNWMGANNLDVRMWLLGSLLKGGLRLGDQNRVIGWMPFELAGSEEEAGALMEEIIFEATKKSLPQYSIEEGTVAKPSNSAAYGLKRWDVRGWRVKGGECDKVKCQLSHMTARNTYVPNGMLGSKGKAPGWMGGYKAWVFEFGSGTSVYELLVGNEYKSMKYIPELSKNLPEWAYISVAPETDVLGVPFNKGMSIPVVYNKGKVFAPIFPEVDFNSASGVSSGK